jgi:hypothetical protein
MTIAPHKATDARVTGVELYLLPVTTRMPLKFGMETLTIVTCARARVWLTDRNGKSAPGWGETPLSVQWAWPSDVPYADRHAAMIAFCRRLAEAWMRHEACGHPIEIGTTFQQELQFTSSSRRPIAATGRINLLFAVRYCSSRRVRSVARSTDVPDI